MFSDVIKRRPWITILIASKNSSPILYLSRTLTAVATIHIGRVHREFHNICMCKKVTFLFLLSNERFVKCHFVWKRIVFCFYVLFVMCMHSFIVIVSVDLKTEVVGPSVTLVHSYQNTWCYILISHCHENLKPHIHIGVL